MKRNIQPFLKIEHFYVKFSHTDYDAQKNLSSLTTIAISKMK